MSISVSNMIHYDCSNSLSLSMSSTSTVESKSNLIVNYLPQTMNSEEIKTIFQSIGPIESCKLIKDKQTQQSLCFGFVNYLNIEDAEKAIKTLNGLRIENKVIKVSFARPSCDSIKGANLYVCGLPKNWSLDDFNQYFGQCGKIITSRILTNTANGQSKGVGFIRFDQRHEADFAINKLHGSLPDSGAQEPITVKFANYPLDIKNKMFNSSSADNFNVKSVSPSTLQINQLPRLTPATPIFNPRYSFYSPNEIICNENLYQTVCNPVQQQGQQQMPIQQQMSYNQPNSPSWSLFIYNLYPEVDDNVLWQLFGPFGAVQNVKIIRDFQTQKCKGFGFVTMSSYENALNAVNSLNGIVLFNRCLQVSFKNNFRN